MARLFWVLLMAALIAVVPMATALAEGDAEPVPGADEADVGFIEDPVWEDWYGLAEAQGGGLWNFDKEAWAPYGAFSLFGYRAVTGILGAEFDFDENTEEKGIVAAVGGITYHVGTLEDFGLDAIPWSEHIGLNVGLGGRYDFNEEDDDKKFGWTAIVSVLDLSFGNGNAARQRGR